MMTPEALAEYYKGEYRNWEEPTDTSFRKEGQRAERLIGFMDFAPANVLDIGSSTGLLLKSLQSKYGCDVVGIEPNDKYRKYSRRLGLNVLDNLGKLDGEQFDLITIIHTLEHFTEPLELLEKAQNLMADGGKLLIEIPLQNVAYAHPIVFTEKTFERMLNTAGFVIEKAEATARDMRALTEYGRMVE